MMIIMYTKIRVKIFFDDKKVDISNFEQRALSVLLQGKSYTFEVNISKDEREKSRKLMFNNEK